MFRVNKDFFLSYQAGQSDEKYGGEEVSGLLQGAAGLLQG
jgi:hypothetical protein